MKLLQRCQTALKIGSLHMGGHQSARLIYHKGKHATNMRHMWVRQTAPLYNQKDSKEFYFLTFSTLYLRPLCCFLFHSNLQTTRFKEQLNEITDLAEAGQEPVLTFYWPDLKDSLLLWTKQTNKKNVLAQHGNWQMSQWCVWSVCESGLVNNTVGTLGLLHLHTWLHNTVYACHSLKQKQ